MLGAAVSEGNLTRADGWAEISDYAAVGDGRTLALVARDAAIDWLCLPDLDSPATFAALLDRGRGGSFRIAPEEPWRSERRYLPGTNVLETTFRTERARVRVVDALALPARGFAPHRELLRRVECVSGEARLRWSADPRPGWGAGRVRRRTDGPWLMADAGGRAVALRAFGGEASRWDGEVARGRIALEGGQQALLALTAADGEPLVLPGRDDAERRLDDTVAFWERWSRASRADGPWRHAVLRSGLVLKLLVHAPTGSIAAAGTTSLPEELGGVRNWDYRFTWIRDAAFSLDALLRLGHRREADAFFWWLMHASQLRHPDLRPLYRLDGGRGGGERELAFEGYRGSRPVRSGNEALEQLQLDVYGSLLEAVAVFVEAGGQVDPDTGGRMAETADRVCELWRRPDAGIWEVRSAPCHFTHSKLMCWVALDRALRLAQDVVPGYHAGRWRAERAAIERFIERHCWSDERGGYVRHPETEELDASLLMPAFLGYPNRERAEATVDAIRRELADGPFVYRYRGDDGLPGREGAFLACSFWLVNALARVGRVDEAAATMDELLAHANDVGLFAEEFAPDAGRQLGNFPQALTHLALINAAASVGHAVAERQERRST